MRLQVVSVSTCFIRGYFAQRLCCIPKKMDEEPRKRFRGNSLKTPPKTYGFDEGAADLGENYDQRIPESEEAACQIFLDILSREYVLSHISALVFCIICHFVCLAGIHNKARKPALPPGRPSGNYQKHLDRALDLEKSEVPDYPLSLPVYDEKQACLYYKTDRQQ